MQAFQAPRHTLTAIALVTTALLAACGGGGDAADPVGADTTAQPEEAATGRAQALAYTAPPLTAAPPGLSGNVVCTNWRIGAITVDNIEVPAGMACRLNGTVVRGSVQVSPGGAVIGANVNVAGSVQGDQAAHVQVTGTATRIAGSVELEGGGSATLQGIQVAGDVFVNGLADVVLLRNTRVTGNIQFTDNLGGGEITGNRAGGNLQCTGNVPAPIASNNTAALLENQCAPGAGSGGGGGGGGTTPPLSGNVTCLGYTIGAIRLDSVIVPAGQTCTLLGTLLNGSIEVGQGARLLAENVGVTGGVLSDGAAELRIGGASTIGSSVQVQRGALAVLSGMTVNGDLQIDAMAGPVSASGNRLTGNLQAMANRGGLSFVGNNMGGAMQCKDNLPAPTGSGNVASQKQDQCLGL